MTLSLDFLLCHVALGLEMGLCDRCWEGAGPGAQGADGPRRSLRLDDGPLGESDESYKPLSEMHPTTWMDFKGDMLSEKSQCQEVKSHIICHFSSVQFSRSAVSDSVTP